MDDRLNTRVEKDGMRMVFIPAGPFLMGSLAGDKLANADEKPQHSVELDGYWMDLTPVTNAMFAQFVKETGYKTANEKRSRSENWRNPRMGSSLNKKMDHPVVYVAWADAQAYCQWVGRRLPSEAEWEKAARGTDGRLYPWGDAAPLCSLANFSGCKMDTTPVGAYPNGASPYGLLDMAGNVQEWVADWYDKVYHPNVLDHNPCGPASGSYRVLRGGSWYNEARYVRSAARNRSYPDDPYYNIGFRCAR